MTNRLTPCATHEIGWRGISALLATLCLVGCANTSGFRTQQATSPALCYVEYAGNPQDRTQASLELGRRGFSCTPQAIEMGRADYLQSKADGVARSRAVDDISLELIRQGQPRPAVNCVTTGNITTCR